MLAWSCYLEIFTCMNGVPFIRLSYIQPYTYLPVYV